MEIFISNTRPLITIENNLEQYPKLNFGTKDEKTAKFIARVRFAFSVLFLPFTLVAKGIQLSLSSQFILPTASIENRLHKEMERTKRLEYIEGIFKNVKTSIYQARVHSPLGYKNISYGILVRNENYSTAQSNSERKLSIYIPSQAERIGITVSSEMRAEMWYTQENGKGTDFYYVSHPTKSFNCDKNVTIRCATSHIKNLLDIGYKPENISISSLSLGGGISAEMLARFTGYKLPDGRVLGENSFFAEYHNIHSFSTYGTAASGVIFGRINTKVFEVLMNVISTITSFNLNTIKALNTKNFPVKAENINIYTAKSDSIILNNASLEAKKEHLEEGKNYKYHASQGLEHCDIPIKARVK